MDSYRHRGVWPVEMSVATNVSTVKTDQGVTLEPFEIQVCVRWL